MKYKIAMCQLLPTTDLDENMAKFEEMTSTAASKGADFVIFPEIWVCPYVASYFDDFAEEEGGKTFNFMSLMAKKYGVYIFGGSVVEKAGGRMYNTCYVFGPGGDLIGKHRKAHMFDIDVKGGITFKESDSFSPGTERTVVETEFGKVCVAICFDIRFTDFFRRPALDGCHLIVLPAVFNMTTGPAHWELSVRARALDHQVYFAGCQAARGELKGTKAWGHSILADPWGSIVCEADETEQVVIGEIDTDYVESVREQLPILSTWREELDR